MGINKEDLAIIVNDILELTYPKMIRSSKAAKIVKAIQTSMTNALLRGEDIKIDGLGIFRVMTRKARKRVRPYRFHDIGDPRGYKHPPKMRMWKIRDYPEKKFVKFIPSKELIRYINGNPQPNQ